MKMLVKKGSKKSGLKKGMLVPLVEVLYNEYYKGRQEPMAVVTVDKAQVKYPMIFLEFASDTEETLEVKK